MNSRLLKQKNFYEGKIFKTLYYGDCKVVEYVDSGKVIVEFEDGNRNKVSAGNLRKGLVRNLYKHEIVFGVGIRDEVLYKTDATQMKAYQLWLSVLTRTNSKKFLARNKNYENVEICDRWKHFSNFKTDVLNMKGFNKSITDKWELDKDLLSSGSKIYSPDTCCFVPKPLNNLFKKKLDKRETDLPTNVTRNRFSGKLSLRVQISEKEYKYLGQFNSLKEAFPVYKSATILRISNLIEVYGDDLDTRLIDKLLNYNVEKEAEQEWCLS